MWINILIFVISFLLCVPVTYAEPVIGEVPLPPASFTRVDDLDLLRRLGLEGFDGAWCYDDQANAILITAPAREKAQCELKILYEREQERVRNQFEIDKLTLRIETLTKQHEELGDIKDREIERLTKAALDRPNDYTVWWAAGGFTVGIVLTLSIMFAVR